MTMAARGRKGQLDVVLGETPNEQAGSEIVHHLETKGFCVLSAGFDADALEQAVADAGELDFYEPNGTVADGLLGREASAGIAELESSLDDEARSEGDSLRAMDNSITLVGRLIEPHVGRIGFDMTHRSDGVLSEFGEAADESPALTEKDATKWLSQFLRHRIMVLVFLGPRPGVLEMVPYGVEDAEPHQVKTVPGMAVVLRPDLLARSHSSSGKTYILSSFFMVANITESYKLTPPAQVIHDWTLSRLRELKNEQSLGRADWDPEIPRSWQRSMNHLYHKGQLAGICGIACQFPGTLVVEEFCLAGVYGPDYCTEVPLTRWNHDDVYDADPEGWTRFRTTCKHAAFMEGLELFDNKFFSLSPNESRGMDPHCRLILEVGYACVNDMGYSKRQLMNANVGVYVGCGTDEWSFHPGEGASRSVTGALSLFSGRFSFCLGMKGPAITLTTEAAAGLSAAFVAAESVEKKGAAVSNEMAVAIAPSVQLSSMWWPSQSKSGWLSPDGRCLSFNSSSSGYVRGDGCGTIGLTSATEMVDGAMVAKEKTDFYCTIAGAMMNSNGQCSSLTAPHGPSEQEVVAKSITNAGISPADVDTVEAFATGAFLADAIEANSIWRAHRNESWETPLAYTAGKTSIGHQIECSGVTGLFKIIFFAQWANLSPNLHLRQCNPHLDPFSQPINFMNEPCANNLSTYSAVKARGFGGSNVYMITWGIVNRERRASPLPPLEREVLFWPGGGGQLEDSQCPRQRDGYFIVGTWSRWAAPEKMETEGEGAFGYTVTLGENRWEQFQIWLDGSPERLLHPGSLRAPKGSQVYGPDEEYQGGTEFARSSFAPAWLIDGRPAALSDMPLMLQGQDGGAATPVHVGSLDEGMPGDRYRVHLRIAGKWRRVDWEKLADVGGTGRALVPAVASGTYYIAGDFNDWALEEMSPADGSAPGVFHIEIELPQTGSFFQIVRDEDWGQVFYPARPSDPGSVLGPAAADPAQSFYINGRPQRRYRVEFQRELQAGQDVSKVSWREVK